MNKREAKALLKNRLAQIDDAVAARVYSGMPRESRAAIYRERDRQIRLSQQEYERNIAPAPRHSRAKSQSRFWKHFGQDGQPVAPWDIEVGPHVGDRDDDEFDDESMFVEGDYGYEDFDSDWGGYEYSDTGYADEDA